MKIELSRFETIPFLDSNWQVMQMKNFEYWVTVNNQDWETIEEIKQALEIFPYYCREHKYKFLYILRRRSLRQGGPFLSAAVFLSALVTVLTWSNPIVASFVLIVIASLYLLAAVWLSWNWLLLATLLAANLAVLSVNLIFFKDRINNWMDIFLPVFITK